MPYIILKSCFSIIALLCGVRIYCIYYVWGKCKDKSMKGKTIIITGANSGIGKETAQELVKRGAKVIMACRNEDSAKQAIEQINKNHKHSGQLIYKHIDLTSFSSVRKFVDDINNCEKSVDVLINNAGLFHYPFSLTEDGFETQFQVNHLSNALLTMLLLPKLEASGNQNNPSRIVMVSSTLYRRGAFNAQDFKKESITVNEFGITKAYSNSKLANILFGKALDENLQKQKSPVRVYYASPGIVWTNLNRHVKIPLWQMVLLSPFALLFLRSARQGCQTVLHCAVADSLVPATFYRNCSEYIWHGDAKDPNICRKAYDLTMKAIEM